MSRLTIEMTDQQHESLAAMAALQDKTVGQYAIERLFPSGADDEEQAWSTLKTILNGRIEDALAGRLSRRGVAEILDDELGVDRRD